MALFEILIPQLMNCGQNSEQDFRNLMDQDWNHWKLQVQSWMEDAQVNASKAESTGAQQPRSSPMRGSCGRRGGSCGSQNRSGGSCHGANRRPEPSNPLNVLHQMWSQFANQSQRGEREEASNNLVKEDARKHVIKLDVSNFEPNEISVKIVDNQIVVDGEHPERTDALGLISRKFQRKYELPSDVEPETIVSTLTASGVLIIEGLKKSTPVESSGDIVIPVIREQTNTSSDDQNKYENDQKMD